MSGGAWLAAGAAPVSGGGTDGLAARALEIWAGGGWLMVPLLALTVFIYGTALNLLFRVQFHFLLRGRVHRRDPGAVARGGNVHLERARRLLRFDASDPAEVRRHFEAVRNEYLPFIDRRIRFLGIIITAGPLLGLLGTVTGMLSTFSGMVDGAGTRFESVVEGISEALITTQTGLLIAVPAMVLLSLIIQRRNSLMLAIARLERYNTRVALRGPAPAAGEAA
mgnify:CR=1 FL=1